MVIRNIWSLIVGWNYNMYNVVVASLNTVPPRTFTAMTILGPHIARGDKSAMMELSFTHVTCKTWEHFKRFGIFSQKMAKLPQFWKIKISLRFIIFQNLVFWHFLWTLFVEIFCGHFLWTFFVDTFCGHFLYFFKNISQPPKKSIFIIRLPPIRPPKIVSMGIRQKLVVGPTETRP